MYRPLPPRKVLSLSPMSASVTSGGNLLVHPAGSGFGAVPFRSVALAQPSFHDDDVS